MVADGIKACCRQTADNPQYFKAYRYRWYHDAEIIYTKLDWTIHGSLTDFKASTW